MEDKELKKKLKKIPDVDAGGDPIYKIDTGGGSNTPGKKGNKPAKKSSG